MKTCLFSSCYLDGKDAQGNDRLERTKRYLAYYHKHQKKIGFDDLILLDNGSSPEKQAILKNVDSLNVENLSFFKSLPHFEHGRSGIPYDYRHCWRTFYHYKQLIEEGYKKIIIIDTDTFVVSKKLAAYIKSLKSGYTTFWSRRYQFTTAELTILCEDKFERILKVLEAPIESNYGKLMEQNLPFTQVNVEFNVDRFGEWGEPLKPEHDAYGQAGPSFVPRLI